MKQNGLLKQISVRNKHDLTARCKKLFNEAMKLKNKNKLKSRVKLIEKFTDLPITKNLINKFNTRTYNFFMSQIKSQKNKT